MVKPHKVQELLTEDTMLVAVMLVNNETGAIQPVENIVKTVREYSSGGKRRIHIHCDGVQALGKIPFDIKKLDADTVSFSAHKLNGPRGAGILYTKNRFETLAAGGGQENDMRPGTENLPAIHGMSLAIEKSVASLDEHFLYGSGLSRFLIDGLRKIHGCRLLPEGRTDNHEAFSPWIVNAAFPPVPGEVLVRSC